MTFLILTTHGPYEIEAEDFSEAADHAYDNHTGNRDVMAIVKTED